MKTLRLCCGTCVVVVGAMVVGGAHVARAENVILTTDGRVVQVRPNAVAVIGNAGEVPVESSDSVDTSSTGDTTKEKASYWVGILGRPVPPELRAQIDIPEGRGLLVRHIVPSSPAAKSELKEYDILLRGNDSDLKAMSDLAELVGSVGPKKAVITLEVLRQGKRLSIDITPAERLTRPAAAKPEAGSVEGWILPGDTTLKQMTEMKEKWNAGGGSSGSANEGQMFRFFGPGVVLSGSSDMSGMPSGISVSIERKDNQPPHITVKRGDQTWEATSDNLESLNQLPADLRPFVVMMLNSASSIPMSGPPQFVRTAPNMPRMGNMADAEKRMQERLDQMEQHLKELEERMHNASGANSPDSAK